MRMKMNRERGAILLLALLGLGTVSILAGAFVQMGVSEQRFSERSQGGVQAFYLSESAIDAGLSWLRSQAASPAWTDRRVLFGGWQRLGSNGWYRTAIDPDDNNPVSHVKRFTIEGEGVVGAIAGPMAARQNRMVVQTENFAQYAYFTDEEQTRAGLLVWFVTGDRIEGPTHTNGRFSMYGRPVFDGPVSSVADRIHRFGGPAFTDPVFREPPRLGVPPKQFPTEYPRSITDSARSGGTVLRGDTAVTLLSDGTMRVTNAARGLTDAVMPLPANGVLYVDGGDVALKGELSGQLTLGTSGSVKVVDSVTYADDPRRNPESQDLLGIVAAREVIVPAEAPHDLQIHASIMALDTSFGVENYWIGPPKGTLTVYGGLIQKNRGPVGRFNPANGEKLSGYTKDYHYDTRLQSMAPPAFPGTGDYKTLVWQKGG